MTEFGLWLSRGVIGVIKGMNDNPLTGRYFTGVEGCKTGISVRDGSFLAVNERQKFRNCVTAIQAEEGGHFIYEMSPGSVYFDPTVTYTARGNNQVMGSSGRSFAHVVL